MNGSFRSHWFDELPVVGILRGFNLQQVRNLVACSARGGLRNLEITMNSAGATDLIALACELAGDRMNIGAGTVLTERDLDDALQAGASFIVTPIVNELVIERCRRLKVPVYPGALSPSEVVRAWDLGATMVKVFPAETLGPAFVRSLKAPLPHIRLLPTGGVSLVTLESYARAGAEGFGVGSPLFDAQRVRNEDWQWIEEQCVAFRAKYDQIRKAAELRAEAS